MQSASWMVEIFTPPACSINCGAPKGQTSTHLPHPRQSAGSTCAMTPSATISFCESIVIARETAPRACATDSLANFGPWARPQRKKPAVAKSSGRSLRWASRKKPSWSSGKRKVSASLAAVSAGRIAALKTRRSDLTVTGLRSCASWKVTSSPPPFCATTGFLSTSKRKNRTPSRLAS